MINSEIFKRVFIAERVLTVAAILFFLLVGWYTTAILTVAFGVVCTILRPKETKGGRE